MEAHGASLHTPHPDAVEFVRFCYRRRRVGWPELYDEMCAVAARGKFRGMSTDELSGLGIGFSLFDMPGLAGLAATVIAEEQAMRRPVAVAIVAEPQAVGPGIALRRRATRSPLRLRTTPRSSPTCRCGCRSCRPGRATSPPSPSSAPSTC